MIQSHPRRIEQLMKLAGVKASSRPQKVPGHPLIDEVDNSAALDMAESTVFRSCVGILLYLAADLPHCQHAIRYLSTGMSSPTKQKKDILRHLISFLHGTKDVCALTTKVTMLVFITNTPRRPMRSIWKCFQILIGVQTSNIGSQSVQAMYVVEHPFFSHRAEHKR